ncbi:MAG: IS91 family transposase [Acidobacteriota bacterium]|nr:IS91 family transposase [Acidobacteriota bacterium]
MSVPVADTSPVRSNYEVADIFRQFGAQYRREHRLPVHHHQVMRAIEQCRTAALGGHLDECDSCGQQQISYNSCRDRHCPKCQATARRKWVAAREAELLPIEYFHVVFTLPEPLVALARYNQALIYNLLFRAMSQTLLEFGARHWRGELGITAVLHTWGQTMCEHPHVHCIVTGGALAHDGSWWRSCRRGFLFPVKALSAVFRGKYCAWLERSFARGEVKGEQALPMLASAESFAGFLRELRRQAFVVYAKRPFGGPQQVLSYIGRYTHRVAIANQRITDVSDGQVSFRYTDYRDGGQEKVLRLCAAEFIRRFLQHVLPRAFVRIRHYGLVANGRKDEKLARCRALLATVSISAQPGQEARVEERSVEVAGEGESERCAACGVGRMVRRAEVPPGCGPPSWDVVRRAA